jgi:hypothetical protein
LPQSAQTIPRVMSPPFVGLADLGPQTTERHKLKKRCGAVVSDYLLQRPKQMLAWGEVPRKHMIPGNVRSNSAQPSGPMSVRRFEFRGLGRLMV